jgi:tetratricopeptide (TPR) repeat protein
MATNNATEKVKGVEKLQLLERSHEALSDSIRILAELIVNNNDSKSARKSLYIARNHMATTLYYNGNSTKNNNGAVESLLLNTLQSARNDFGDMDNITATTLNNLGLFYKNIKNYDTSINYYKECLHIRTITLGESHPETIISMHNLSELYIASNDVDAATAIQENIMKIVENKNFLSKDENMTDSSSSSSSSDKQDDINIREVKPFTRK